MISLTIAVLLLKMEPTEKQLPWIVGIDFVVGLACFYYILEKVANTACS